MKLQKKNCLKIQEIFKQHLRKVKTSKAHKKEQQLVSFKLPAVIII